MEGFRWRCDYSCHHCLFQLDAISVCDFWQLAIVLFDITLSQSGASWGGSSNAVLMDTSFEWSIISGYMAWTQLSVLVKFYAGQHCTSAEAAAPVLFILSNERGWPGALLGLSLCLAILTGCEHANGQCWESSDAHYEQNNYDFLWF